jgi:hypothetical protein
MKRFALFVPVVTAALAAAALLSGCSADPQRQGQSTASESSYTSVGSYIPRKKSAGAGPDNVANADLQALENARINGNGTLNLPQR